MYKNCLSLVLVFVLLLAGSAHGVLVGHWEMDGNGLDSSGYGNNGTAVNTPTPTTDRLGNPNSAMAFDGVVGAPDAFDCGNDTSVQISGAMTITAWVYLNSTSSTNGRILSKLGIPSGVDWSYSLNIENYANGVSRPSTFMVGKPANAGRVEIIDNVPLTPNVWVHMAGVYTPGVSLKIYLDGDLAAINTTSIPASQYSNGTSHLYIGSFQGGNDVGWNGALDDIRLYNEALSEAEIEAIMLGTPVVKATSPSPGDAATGVGINDDLSWTAGASAVSHDVYFGTSLAAVTNASRLLGDIDGSGSVGVADLTVLAQQWLGAPVEPYADLDGDDDVNMADFAVVSGDWLDSSDAVYKGNQSGTTFDPGALASNTTYYWRVDEVNGAEEDSPWIGDVWSFSTVNLIPGQASAPSPGNSATGVGADDDLSWTAGANATSHDVYFGQDSTPDAGEFQGNQAGVTFEPGTMEDGETYYWRVDEVNAYGTTTGAVWSFTIGGSVTLKIMPLGDSITQGYTTYDNYRHILWDKLQSYGYTYVDFVGSHDVLAYDTYDSLTFDKDHEGHYGWTTDQIRDGGGNSAGGTGNLTTWLTGLQSAGELPDIVLMHLGTNDVVWNSAGYDQNITIGEMEDVIDVLRSYNPNVTILLAIIIPHKPDAYPSVDNLNALIPGLDSYDTATSEVIIVDHYTGFSTTWLADDFHPNTTGATEMSNRWFDALQPLLGQSLIETAGHWKLDETSGTTANDSSGNGINGTLVNMDDTDWVSGMVSGALDFDGVNDYVVMGRSSVLEIGNATTHELSVSAWVKSDYTSAPAGYTTIVGSGDGGWLIANSPGTDTIYLACWLLNGSSGQTAVASNPTVVHDGDWHFIVGVFDGASVHMYVDGDHAEAGTIGGTIRNMFDLPVRLGENGAATGRRWDGLIDDVKIYDVGLSEADVAYLENPNIAWDPSPADGSTSMSIYTDLSWSAGTLAVSHDVYLGTDSAAVASATNASGEFQGNQTATTFDPGTLDAETDYYWRVDEINTSNPSSPWTGKLWSFTTKVATGRQTLNESITSRRYILYVPLDYNPSLAYPLIISSHGTSQNGDTEMDSTGPNSGFDNGTPTWPTLAEDNDVIVACPDMTGAYGPCSIDATHLSQLAEDDTAIMNIISEIQGSYNINSSAILMTGFSGGGNVVHYTGLRHADVFRASCARHGNFSTAEVPSPLPAGTTDMPVYIFTGSSDSTCGPADSITWYTAEGFSYLDTETFTTYPSNVHTTDRHHALYWFLDVIKPRVIVSTDIGGDDPDDFQSMVHYLVCADRFDTEGLIASPPYAGRLSDILATIDAYETDYSNLSSHGNFPTPQSLRDVSKQGAINISPAVGYSTATDGSNLIISAANNSDARPLWIQVWGSITDIAQAVHDDPSIKGKIRVYSIGSWNTDQDPYARNYLYNNHSDMWWIENDTTFFGMWVGGDQSGDLGNSSFVSTHVRYHGALGDFYYSKKTDLKMGDTPSVLYMMDGNINDPTTPHWGGMFQTTGHGANYWHDLTDPQYAEAPWNGWSTEGAKTVNVHREAYLRDFQARMDWADAP